MRHMRVLLRTNGFSLIEVLVAAFILFLVLTTVTITYSGAVKSTLSATESVNLNGYVPLLIEDIGLSVREGNNSGSGSFLGVSYDWQTTLLESKDVASFYDSDSIQMASTGKTAYLWQVLLVTRYNGKNAEHKFKVVSWAK